MAAVAYDEAIIQQLRVAHGQRCGSASSRPLRCASTSISKSEGTDRLAVLVERLGLLHNRSGPSRPARCSWCCRGWTPRARTARSAMCSPGRQPAGLPRRLVQGALRGRAGPRTTSGASIGLPRTRRDRDLQPLPLRRRRRGSGARSGRQTRLGPSLRADLRLRAHAQRGGHGHRQSFPARLTRRADRAAPRAARQPRRRTGSSAPATSTTTAVSDEFIAATRTRS